MLSDSSKLASAKTQWTGSPKKLWEPSFRQNWVQDSKEATGSGLSPALCPFAVVGAATPSYLNFSRKGTLLPRNSGKLQECL
jgi:hypothetical protein